MQARSDERRGPWLRWGPAVLALALCVAYLVGGLHRLDGELGLPLDDSWIHLQFARNLARGDGLSFNPGELVAGSTAPLWTALVSVLFLLPGGPVAWTLAAGVALHVASAELVYRVGRELDLSPRVASLGSVLTVLTGWLVWSALSALEIPLFVVLGLAGMLFHLRERRAGSPPTRSLAVLALAALARPEGLLLLVLAVADRVVRFERPASGAPRWVRPAWRELAAGTAVALVPLAAVAAFNHLVGGSSLPTTFGAKLGDPADLLTRLGGLLPDPAYLYRVPGAILFRAQPWMLLLAGAGVVELVSRLGGERDRGLLPAAWLFGLPLAYGVLSAASGQTVAGNFGRYYFPLFPVVVLVGLVGAERILDRRSGPGPGVGGRRLALRAALLALVLWPTVSASARGLTRYAQNLANVRDSDVAAARWLRERLAPEAVLAVNDVGAFGYLLPNRVLDLAGIIHPAARRYRVAAARRGLDPHAGTLRFLEERRPDYLAVFPEWFPGLLAEGSPYRLVEAFPIPDNITMGGDRVVVLATPWTRFPLPSEEP